MPVKQKTLKIKERHLIYVYVRCKGETAIHRRGPGDIWQGLYEPWLIENATMNTEDRLLDNFQSSIFNLQLIAKGVKHVLTHRILLADFYLLEVEEKPVLPPDYFWIPETELDSYAVPRLIEKLLQEVRYA